jgi:hypothetical protein
MSDVVREGAEAKHAVDPSRSQWAGLVLATIGAVIGLGTLTAVYLASDWERGRYCDGTYVTAIAAVVGATFGLVGAAVALMASARSDSGPTEADSRRLRNLSVLLGVAAAGLSAVLLVRGLTGVCNL